MKIFLSLLFITGIVNGYAQRNDALNTAKNCKYMTADEIEMIYEINRVRSNPRSYLQYLAPQLEEARSVLKKFGKGQANYSLTFTTEYVNNKEVKKIDTTWHFTNEEEVNALETLIEDLNKLKKLSVLKPDAGIYKAASKHAADQDTHDWKLMHTGSDGSNPWDRIIKYSPTMKSGSENIAGNSDVVTARDIVIQLLIDSGIPGYGHRYNILDPNWTHVACKGTRLKNGMNWWIQNFGAKK